MLRVQVVTEFPNGGPGYNNFYLEGAEAEAAAAHAAVATLFDGLKSVLTSQATYHVLPEIEQVDPVTGNITAVYSATEVVAAGTWGSNTSPSGTCLVLRWRTGVFVNGRELRGRSFISGLGTIAEGSALVPSGVITDVQNAQAAYLGAAPLSASVYSPTHGQEAEIVTATCWNRFGLMRSRRD